ncbi:MAG: dTDP-4-dehydrorhamnose 3,5-epimerase [Acidobacteriota bacterium]
MKFEATPLAGSFVIELEPHRDLRGFFARSYCDQEFAAHGLITHWPQCNVSFNRALATLRGLHYAAPPVGEEKLVRCTRGSIYDVIVDLRRESTTALKWFGVELTASNHRMLYIPGGFAHGFLTLEPDTEVFYQMGSSYQPSAARGIRWDDPRLGVVWPMTPKVISDQDRALPGVSGDGMVW